MYSKNGQEVCYSADRSEYMRYDPETRLYTYQSLHSANIFENVGGLESTFSKEKVPLSARLDQTRHGDILPKQPQAHGVEKVASTGTL